MDAKIGMQFEREKGEEGGDDGDGRFVRCDPLFLFFFFLPLLGFSLLSFLFFFFQMRYGETGSNKRERARERERRQTGWVDRRCGMLRRIFARL